jgi:hypothetical protein
MKKSNFKAYSKKKAGSVKILHPQFFRQEIDQRPLLPNTTVLKFMEQ